MSGRGRGTWGGCQGRAVAWVATSCIFVWRPVGPALHAWVTLPEPFRQWLGPAWSLTPGLHDFLLVIAGPLSDHCQGLGGACLCLVNGLEPVT